MLRYKRFLNEGGNIQLGKKGENGPKAAPFDSTKRHTTAPDIHQALGELHDRVKKETGSEIFGSGKQALKTGTAYHTGSTRHFFDNNIAHGNYAKNIPKTGDIDTLINREHKDNLNATLDKMPAGTKLGKTKFLGWKKGGDESHILLQHPDHEHPIQVDLNHVKYHKDEPMEGARFARTGGSLEDRGQGIKGEQHKRLIHSVAKLKGMKWGPKGLKNDADAPSADGDQDPKGVSTKLFGKHDEDIHSFSGVTKLIKQHIPAHQHQEVMNHFAGEPGSEKRNEDGMGPAIKHLQKHLGVK